MKEKIDKWQAFIKAIFVFKNALPRLKTLVRIRTSLRGLSAATSVNKAGFSNNLLEKEGLHYITLYFVAQWDKKQEPKLMEPNSCEGWQWFDTEELPENIWENIKVVLKEIDL
jgi:hypothetical protein